MPKQTTHFWIGNFKNESTFKAFFEEQYSDDEAAVSRFAASQNETWIDHDFLEIGFHNDMDYSNFSYSIYWINELKERMSQTELNPINAFIMLSNDKDYSPVKSPKSYKGDNLELRYMGTISYNY